MYQKDTLKEAIDQALDNVSLTPAAYAALVEARARHSGDTDDKERAELAMLIAGQSNLDADSLVKLCRRSPDHQAPWTWLCQVGIAYPTDSFVSLWKLSLPDWFWQGRIVHWSGWATRCRLARQKGLGIAARRFLVRWFIMLPRIWTVG